MVSKSHWNKMTVVWWVLWADLKPILKKIGVWTLIAAMVALVILL